MEEFPTQRRQDKALVWDSGSSLYDSFELKSFKRQLDSAILSRTQSMPHLSEPRLPTQPIIPTTQSNSKKSSRISRSLQKLVRSVFRPKSKLSMVYRLEERELDGSYTVYDRYGGLSVIPEVSEHGGVSPEKNSIVGKSVSERFRPTSIGISRP